MNTVRSRVLFRGMGSPELVELLAALRDALGYRHPDPVLQAQAHANGRARLRDRPDDPAPARGGPLIRYRRVGGLRFLRLGRLQLSWCVIRRAA